jgi:uncharacterized membrane protein HdeD (DUF308 family)
MALRYLSEGRELVRRRWVWFLLFGFLIVLLGMAALVMPWAATITAVSVFGWLLLLSGLSEVAGGFLARGASGMFIDIVMGALTAVVALLFIGFPDLTAMVITIVLAGYFIIAGAFRIYTATLVRFPGRSWALASGAIAILLGIFVLTQWPVSSMWLIGTLVGVELLCRGTEWIAFALVIKRLLGPVSSPGERPMGAVA